MNISSIAKALGQRGGRARALKLGAEKRKQIASSGGKARAESYQTKKRIMENFRYVEAIEGLHPSPRAIRLKNPKKPLPGLIL